MDIADPAGGIAVLYYIIRSPIIRQQVPKPYYQWFSCFNNKGGQRIV